MKKKKYLIILVLILSLAIFSTWLCGTPNEGTESRTDFLLTKDYCLYEVSVLIHYEIVSRTTLIKTVKNNLVKKREGTLASSALATEKGLINWAATTAVYSLQIRDWLSIPQLDKELENNWALKEAGLKAKVIKLNYKYILKHKQ